MFGQLNHKSGGPCYSCCETVGKGVMCAKVEASKAVVYLHLISDFHCTFCLFFLVVFAKPVILFLCLCSPGAVEVSRKSPVASWLCAMLYCFGSYILADIILGVSPIDYFQNNSHILLASAVWWGHFQWLSVCTVHFACVTNVIFGNLRYLFINTASFAQVALQLYFIKKKFTLQLLCLFFKWKTFRKV